MFVRAHDFVDFENGRGILEIMSRSPAEQMFVIIHASKLTFIGDCF